MEKNIPILRSERRTGIRRFRGWIYRRWPRFCPGGHRKRMVGYARRWGLEERGQTWEGLCQLVWEKVLLGKTGGKVVELSAGDGLVGSLGRWLEENHGWHTECEEIRAIPFRDLQKNRAKAFCCSRIENLLNGGVPDVITSRSSRGATWLLQRMKATGKRPGLLGIWNRSGRPLWAVRLARMGYRPVLAHDRMEFYQRR